MYIMNYYPHLFFNYSSIILCVPIYERYNNTTKVDKAVHVVLSFYIHKFQKFSIRHFRRPMRFLSGRTVLSVDHYLS